MRKIRKIIVHHSAGPRRQTTEQIRRYHVQRRGWRDIGYHFVIEGDGSIHRGRDWKLQGAHAIGHNRDSIGICVVGDNTRDKERWTRCQIISLKELVRFLIIMFPDARLMGHKDVGQTLCPGVELREVWRLGEVPL